MAKKYAWLWDWKPLVERVKRGFAPDEVLAVAVDVYDHFVYIAAKYNRPGKAFDGEISAWVGRFDLCDNVPRFDTTYDVYSEGEDPVRHKCPEKLLQLLTPTTNKYSLQWRAECRKRAKRVTAVHVVYFNGEYL